MPNASELPLAEFSREFVFSERTFLLKLNMYFALLWLKKIVRLHVVVFWGSLLHNLRLSAVANFLFLATPKQ